MLDRKKIVRNRNYYRSRLKIILGYLDCTDKTILDLGCGEMLLKQELEANSIRSYTGVDSLCFNNESSFFCEDLFDFALHCRGNYNYIFCLGVIDHLQLSDKNRLIELYKRKFNELMIISQMNLQNLFLQFFIRNEYVEFHNSIIQKIFLLKIPKTSFVFDLSRYKYLRAYCATEIIYLLRQNDQSH
ncbi:MAG: hypothetical protein IT267_05070 [Saprospiraceae bacterium]|nr:hypothetical protein [Saprospiraceae bacterium]